MHLLCVFATHYPEPNAALSLLHTTCMTPTQRLRFCLHIYTRSERRPSGIVSKFEREVDRDAKYYTRLAARSRSDSNGIPRGQTVWCSIAHSGSWCCRLNYKTFYKSVAWDLNVLGCDMCVLSDHYNASQEMTRPCGCSVVQECSLS